MANNLWTAFLANNGSNEILAASCAEGGSWTPSVPINQTSPFTPSLALFNDVLYVAFITDDEDSATGVPSNRIFLSSTTDGVSWSAPTFFNQYSKCAPSLAVWNGSLHIAFVANTSDTLLVHYSSTPGDPSSWAATVDTKQTSAFAPSLAAYPASGANSKLYMAFVAENGSQDIFVCSLASNGQWTLGPSTGQTCQFTPSLAASDSLYMAFAAQNGSKDLYVCSLGSDGRWGTAVLTNQSTSAAPSLAAFNSGLSVGFIANDPGGQLLFASTSNPAAWSGDVYTQQQSAAGPAVAVAPFSCCSKLVKFSGTLGGNSQYVFWSNVGNNNQPNPVKGLVVEIDIDSALVVSATKGKPAGSSIGFQINGLPARGGTSPSPTAGDLATGWQQYGIKMWPSPVMLTTWSQYWPPAVLQNPDVLSNFTANLPNSKAISMASYLNIPSWKIRFVFNYAQDGTTITGFECTVKDGNGNSVNSDMGIDFLQSPNELTSGAPITLKNLSQMVAFQVVLVGFYDSANAFLEGGGGSITVQASTPLTVETTWSFPDTVGNGGTAENSNCTYRELPSCPSKSFTQPFMVG